MVEDQEGGGPANKTLPVKLRFKQKSREAAEKEREGVARDPQEVQEEPTHPSLINRSSGPLQKASKIAGVAPKTSPRVGPQFQATIPDLKH